MIRTTQLTGAALRFSHNRGGVVPADIEKATEQIIAAADEQDGYSGDLGGHVASWIPQLVYPSYGLPGFRKYSGEFKVIDLFSGIPRRGNSPGTVQLPARIITLDDVPG